MIDLMQAVRDDTLRFIRSCEGTRTGEYKYSLRGGSNLYSSAYALMTRHYLSDLALSEHEKEEWADYLNSWQREDGSFLGPELLSEFPPDAKHDLEHLTLHLAITVIPCLNLLGKKPRYRLRFAHKFADSEFLTTWLAKRNWSDAWLEGNNLLFVMQLQAYLRDEEGVEGAAEALEHTFRWLDAEVDPTTGLWGTNGHCSPFIAMCGGYHQLLMYYAEGRSLNSPKELIDVTLNLQHPDGGFSPEGGGGACEDVDAVDILVNLYKRYEHKRGLVRLALRRNLDSIIRSKALDGGFVYRLNEDFTHMGMAATLTPANSSTMFATWFRVHTIALICEILVSGGAKTAGWAFNTVPSMGWHDISVRNPCPGDTFSAHLGELTAAGPKEWLKTHIGWSAIQRLKGLLGKAT